MSETATVAAAGRAARVQARRESVDVLDVQDLFGPLASMHAALDAAGIGTPCGAVAFFEGRSVSELRTAVSVARHRFPVLQTRLAWRRGRPVLGPHPVGAPGGIWDHRLTPTSDGVWFHGCWRHAAGDGRSMLRFLQALDVALGAPASEIAELRPRHPVQIRPMAPWLCQFLADRQRRYARMRPVDPSAPLGVSWLLASPEDRDRLLNAAAEDGYGFLGPLAAAAAAAFCEQQVGSRGGLVSLNVPIARTDLPELCGFGFGVGSLLLPVRVRAGVGAAELGLEISQRTRALAAEGFDRNLDRFLGGDPLRHRMFSAVRALGPADPTVVVSWKGRHELGGMSRTACFAGSPTLHVSAHADRNGLSISVSSRQSAAARGELLQGVAERLGLQAFNRIDFEEIAPDPLLDCVTPKRPGKPPPSGPDLPSLAQIRSAGAGGGRGSADRTRARA